MEDVLDTSRQVERRRRTRHNPICGATLMVTLLSIALTTSCAIQQEQPSSADGHKNATARFESWLKEATHLSAYYGGAPAASDSWNMETWLRNGRLLPDVEKHLGSFLASPYREDLLSPALVAFGEFQCSSEATILLAYLHEKDQVIRGQAIRAAGRGGDSRYLLELLHIAATDEIATCRAKACAAATEMKRFDNWVYYDRANDARVTVTVSDGRKVVMDILLERAVVDEDSFVRQIALEAVRKMTKMK